MGLMVWHHPCNDQPTSSIRPQIVRFRLIPHWIRLTFVTQAAIWFNRGMKFPFQTIALIGKYKTPEITEPLLRLAAFLTEKGMAVVVNSRTAENISKHPYQEISLEQMGDRVDLAIVLGGDGTMLNIVRTLAPYGVPLVGVNQGRLGFLTDISVDTMQQTIGAMLEGKFVTEQRMLLTTQILRGKVEVFAIDTHFELDHAADIAAMQHHLVER